MRLNDVYQDRGIVKYNGFFLSEHTTSLNNEQKETGKIIKGKEQMSETLIFEIIDFAIFKSKRISIQLNMKDIEGNFLEDIEGFVNGYDEENIYLDDIKVPLMQIRHVTEIKATNWFKRVC